MTSIFVSLFESIKMTSYCKESNKLVGSSNFLAWKKRIDLILIENEVVGHVKGLVFELLKEEAQALAKHIKGEIRA